MRQSELCLFWFGCHLSKIPSFSLFHIVHLMSHKGCMPPFKTLKILARGLRRDLKVKIMNFKVKA